jgi:hypothetical protein
MRNLTLLGLLLAGCAGREFADGDTLLATVSPGRHPRWVQCTPDGRVAAFTEVAEKGADHLVVTGRPLSTWHFL